MAQRSTTINPFMAEGPSATSPNSKHTRAHSVNFIEELKRLTEQPAPTGNVGHVSPLPPTVPTGTSSNVGGETNSTGSNSKNPTFTKPQCRMFKPPGTFEREESNRINSYREELPTFKITWTRLEILCLVAFVILVIVTLIVQGAPTLDILRVNLWRWLVLATLFFSGRVISKLFITLIISVINKSYINGRERIHFWHSIKKSLSNFLWFSATWLMVLIFGLISPTEQEPYNAMVHNYVKTILFSMIVSTVFWITKIISIEMFVVLFYRKRYFKKIKTALATQYALECLLRRPVLLNQRRLENSEPLVFAALVHRKRRRGRKVILEQVAWQEWDEMHAANISPRRLTNFVKFIRYSRIVALDESLEQLSWSVGLAPGQSRCDKQATIVSHQIIINVFGNSEVVKLIDIEGYMPLGLAKVADTAIRKPESGNSITKTDLRDWVVLAFNRRRALELSLLDFHALVKAIDYVLGYVVMASMFSTSLLIILDNTAAVILFVFILSNVTVVSCYFSKSICTLFDCLQFVFVSREFDVGDTCRIDGEKMFVDKINLMNTIFVDSDNEFHVSPNHVLLSKDIKVIPIYFEEEDSNRHHSI